MGKGSDVSLSVCHPRSLPPGVAVQPRTGPPAHLLGLGAAWAGTAASGSCTLTAASPACWVPCSCCWPCSQGPPPAGCLVRRGQDVPLCSYFCAFLSCLNLSSTLPGGIGVGGWWVLLCPPLPHSLGSPTSKVHSSHMRPRSVGGEQCVNAFRECVWGPSYKTRTPAECLMSMCENVLAVRD